MGIPLMQNSQTTESFATQSCGNFTDSFHQMTEIVIPISSLDEKYREHFRDIRLQESVAAYTDMVKRGDKAVFRMAWPADAVHHVAPTMFTNPVQCLSAWYALPRSAVVDLLNTVRNRVLTFAIEIEKIAPDAGEGTGDNPAIQPSQVAPVYINAFYGGAHNVAVGSHQFSQSQQTLVDSS